MRMPRIWEILREFKDSSKRQGWKIPENEDWIETGGTYHNFLWTREVHLSSFKKIALNGKCVVREGLSYRVVKTSYTAWLFSEPPSEALVKAIIESPDFSSRIAIYDLSPLLEGKNTCVKLNNTESSVFQEFESFLKNKLKVRLKPLPLVSDVAANPDTFTVTEIA
jgi:hypothetical protein